MVDIHTVAAASTGFALKDIIPLAPAAVALAALWFSDVSNKRTLAAAKENTERAAAVAKATAEAAAWQKANEAELRAIQERLDGFYGPFRTMSDVNRLMFRVLRSRSDHNLVLMRDLFDPAFRAKLPAGEAALLQEIAANAKKLRAFIEANVGMVNAKVMPYLSRAAAHYRMLELAYDGKLGNDPEAFKPFVFPASIETVLGLEVARLEARRDWLMKHPYEAPPPFAPLEIPARYDLAEWTNPARTSTADLTAPLEAKD